MWDHHHWGARWSKNAASFHILLVFGLFLLIDWVFHNIHFGFAFNFFVWSCFCPVTWRGFPSLWLSFYLAEYSVCGAWGSEWVVERIAHSAEWRQLVSGAPPAGLLQRPRPYPPYTKYYSSVSTTHAPSFCRYNLVCLFTMIFVYYQFVT